MKGESLKVAESYLRLAAREAETSARWLGRSKRTMARDRVRVVVEVLRDVLRDLENGGGR